MQSKTLQLKPEIGMNDQSQKCKYDASSTSGYFAES